MRPGLVDDISKELGPELVSSVDWVQFDRAGPSIVIDVTSSLTSRASLRDAAWMVTQAALRFWEPTTLRRVPNAVPALHLTLNRMRIECSPELMFMLGYGDASREQWTAVCVGLP